MKYSVLRLEKCKYETPCVGYDTQVTVKACGPLVIYSVLYYIAVVHLFVHLSVRFTLFSQIPLIPKIDFYQTWYKKKFTMWKYAYYKGIVMQCFLKELVPLDLGLSMQNTLSSQLLL